MADTKIYHQYSVGETIEKLQTDSHQGLSQKEISTRLKKYGKNELKEKGQKTVFEILFDQVKEIMIIILFAAAVISFVLGEYTDSIVILIILLLNTMLGFWQEFKAEKAMAALKKLTVPIVRVKRDGAVAEISAKDIVPGDLVLLEAGNIVPADARISVCSNLKVQEATLTGESESVEKTTDAISGDNISIGDRKNMVYMGTVITYGRGEALVTSTGMETELGKIATMLQEVEDEETPLQKRLAKLGTKLALLALGLIIVVAGITYLRGVHLKETFLIAISMAVAAIPEGLPAIVTIALALGARKMLKGKALIRHLPAVETLGSVTVICSDKTGTLTQNVMTVTQLVMVNQKVEMEDLNTTSLTDDMRLMLINGTLCNDAVLKQESQETIGDPTEGALVIAADKMEFKKGTLSKHLTRVDELPFDSERKRMTTIHQITAQNNPAITKIFKDLINCDQYILFTKGSADGLLEISDQVLIDGKVQPLTEEIKEKILEENQELAENGIRVLGYACKKIAESDIHKRDQYENKLIFVGMTGMIDPVRPEVKDAVTTCLEAGIRPIMITGDHPLTALAIGKELGIAQNDNYITGAELAKMTVTELEERIFDTSIFARVSPEHKMKIVDALQDKGQIVSMTGDGVNDAPALKSADIGVAMGITGTDVSKESSDMVLLDDNFTTIVSAVKEGRTIYDNIKKFIKYILTGNTGEVFVMLAGPIMGLPIPLLPIQILWINLVTDGLPAIALGYEPAEDNIMKRPPYDPQEGIFSRGLGRQILTTGSLVGMICIIVGLFAYQTDKSSHGAWQTMIFSTLTFCQMAFALAVRSNWKSIFSKGFFSNPTMLFAVLLTFVLQLGLIYLPFMQNIFRTVALNLQQLGICIGVSFFIIIAVEIEKITIRLKK
ncbi:MAG: calcium-translocating P-type ATPase, PMCA-type [Spirochaetes bacterium]|nr:calcium-translocating P-type ATPase, PMCA-type [Spirochaetota bacterium]